MDDPWGSPWAEEAQFQEKDDRKQKENRTSIADVPAAAATLDFGTATTSPWGDDGGADEDNFGEWSSVPVEMGTTKEKESFETRVPVEAVHAVGIRRKDSATEWPHLHDEAPVESEEGNVALKAAFQSSPDPWNDVSPNDSQASGLLLDANPLAGGQFKNDTDGAERSRRSSVSSHKSQHVGVGKAREDEVGEIVSRLESGTPPDVSLGRGNLDIVPTSPRSSTSQSIGSHHEYVDPHETPRTSSDDEHNRPPMPRKASSRIQPLIEHFDGLSKEEAPVDPPATERVESAYNAVSREDDKSTPVSKKITASDVPSSQPIEKTTPGGARHRRHSSSVDKSSSAIDPNLDFELDTTILDQLFPSAHQVIEVEDVFIPDVVPYESFTSMEQRKTWYRVSRYGSMRKHDSGDDDTYTRVAWMGSRVHDETIKIVARWMEEDRLSGQVMLGGTGRTSALFGWGDAKSPALSLDDVFAARHNQRQSMLSEKNKTFAALDNGVLEGVGTENGERAERHVASFGWSNDTAARTINEQASPLPLTNTVNTSSIRLPIPQSPTDEDPIQPHRMETKPFEAEVSVQVEPHSIPRNVLPISKSSEAFPIDDDEEEDEDDWGEMVSTPVVENPPRSVHVKHADQVESPLTKSAPIETFSQPGVAISSSANPASFSANGGDLPQATAPVSVSDHANMSSWASDDFSFFDSGSHHASQPFSTSSTTLAPVSPIRSKPVRPSPLKQITCSAVDVSPRSTHRDGKHVFSEGEELMYRTTIEGLPDLSYMFKR